MVRSLARGTPASPRYDRYSDSSDEESPRPLERSNGVSMIRGNTGENDESELERGVSTSPPFPRQTPSNRVGAWFGSLTSNFGASSFPPNSSDSEGSRI